MEDSVVSEVRAFNRFYTRQLGLLDEHIAQSRFSLAEGRVLYELGRNGAATAADLAQRLQMDPGYLSRIGTRLIELGLVSTKPDATDRRRSTLAVTPSGKAAVSELEVLNNRAVAALLETVPAPARGDLVAAMQSIQRHFGEGQATAVVLRPPRIGDIGWLVHRQGLLYNRQFGWNADFEALIAGIYGDYHRLPAFPPRDLWVADSAGEICGSIFVQPFEGSCEIAQLRMLYVEPVHRGRGIGRLLVAQAVRFATDSGYRRMRLWTHDVQQDARRLYASAGFGIAETMDEDNFGVYMTGEIWERAL